MAFGLFKKLARGLTRTRENIAATLGVAGAGTPIDDEAIDDLEAGLLGADLGPELTRDVIDSVRQRARESSPEDGLRGLVRAALRDCLAADDDRPIQRQGPPHVVFVVGVNGGGKTTSVGKLAARERQEGRKVILAAADTFRAAAVDQLQTWSERAGAELIKHADGADPAAVVFDALRAATTRGADTVFVDTAGRLHTKTNLMAELAKLARIAGREVEGAPHEVLLVVDATTGQNGLTQAEQFGVAAALTGVVLTKLDGTAKGGVALAIRRRLGVPIRYVGVGEGVDDLLPFDADAYIDGLIGESS